MPKDAVAVPGSAVKNHVCVGAKDFDPDDVTEDRISAADTGSGVSADGDLGSVCGGDRLGENSPGRASFG